MSRQSPQAGQQAGYNAVCKHPEGGTGPGSVQCQQSICTLGPGLGTDRQGLDTNTTMKTLNLFVTPAISDLQHGPFVTQILPTLYNRMVV